MTRRGAANTITEECERLFCGTLRAVFMGEMTRFVQDSLVMGSLYTTQSGIDIAKTSGSTHMQMQPQPRERGLSFASTASYSSHASSELQMHQSAVMQGLGTPSSIASSGAKTHITMPEATEDASLIKQYMEMWDYMGGAKFKGFATSDQVLVVFFDDDVVNKELKSGLMALIELASTASLNCDYLLVCLERGADDAANASMMRDLRWVGFEPTTLSRWSQGFELTSDRWMFLGMDV